MELPNGKVNPMHVANSSIHAHYSSTRTELIPQTTQNLGQGNLFYHFSVMRKDTNAPNVRLTFLLIYILSF